MKTNQTNPHRTSKAAIFARVWETENGQLSVGLARHIAKVGFTAQDKARIHELAVGNREGGLTSEEQQEFDNYIKVGKDRSGQ